MPARGQSKKRNTTQGVFFLLRPRGKAGEGEAPLGAGTGPGSRGRFTGLGVWGLGFGGSQGSRGLGFRGLGV